MNLTVNGEAQTMPEGLRVVDLLRVLALDKAACAVEVNTRLVPKAQHKDHALSEGDRVEIVTLVGGG